MKKNIRRLCVISPRYPTNRNPVHAFIDQLVCEIADNGIECSVISPYSITERILRNTTVLPKVRQRITKYGNTFNIYSPRYISFSTNLLKINTSMLTYKNFREAVIKEYEKRNLEADALYGHFIFPCGMCAADLGKVIGKPSFLAYGESSPTSYVHVKKSVLQDKLRKMSGIISVSSGNKRELLNMGLIENKDIVGVFPNAIDESKFYKIDKSIARRHIGIDDDKFVVAFVGHFIERKGIAVLANVLNHLEDVYSIFIGTGSNEPQCRNILFKGRVPHDQVHIYLNAADVFVLPTFAEGCCNAIIEAMACGLPIISSNQPFNDDILSTENSIRLDVRDEQEIRQAIVLLRDNLDLRDQLSKAALIGASKLDIQKRAQNIIGFMNSKI